MIDVERVSFAYGRQQVLRGIDMTVARGKYTALIGPNGSGKTTLLAILSGMLKPGGGKVRIDGQDLARMPFRERAMRFAIIQQRERVVMPFTCLEVVLMGLSPRMARLASPSPEEMAFVKAIMERTDTAFLMEKPVTQISGGEFQRVLIARALAQRPSLLFLDEAMSDLDVSARLKLLSLLKSQTETEGLTVLAVHHDINTAYATADEVAVLHEGSLRAKGAPEAVLTPALFADIFGVEAEIVPGKGLFFRDAMDK